MLRGKRYKPSRQERITIIKDLLKKEDPVIVEVGSCDFGDTLQFLNIFKKSRVFCFEPHPDMVKLYEEKIGYKNMRCQFFNCAVGGKDGKARLKMAELKTKKGVTPWPGASSIVKTKSYPEQYPELYFTNEVDVSVVRLDTWAKENRVDRVDFIWTDVQGAEAELISGAGELLKRTHYIQLEYGEYSSYPQDALTRDQTTLLMKAHGFEICDALSDANPVRGDIVYVNKFWSNLPRKVEGNHC